MRKNIKFYISYYDGYWQFELLPRITISKSYYGAYVSFGWLFFSIDFWKYYLEDL